jgi:hypothetical protein
MEIFLPGRFLVWYALPMSMIESAPIQPPGEVFEQEASLILRELQSSVAALIGAIRGAERAADVAHLLQIDRALGWKMWKIAASGSSLPAPKHIPGRQGFDRFITAARWHGIQSSLIEAARGAYERFESLADRHAGDRASADILLGSLTDSGRRRLELALRREAFHANSYFFGARTDVKYQIDAILNPEPGYMPSVARFRGYRHLQRMRPGVPWILSRIRLLQSSGPSSSFERTPLDPTDTPVPIATAPPLVRAFCTIPTPQIIRRRAEGGFVEDELAPGLVGEAGAVDVCFGEFFDKIPLDTVDRDAVTVQVRVPCEALVFDILLHRSLARVGSPQFDVYSTLQADTPYVGDGDSQKLPVVERLEPMGPASSFVPVPELPNHASMVRWMLQRIGREPEDFEYFRVTMRHPPLPICLAVHYRTRA